MQTKVIQTHEATNSRCTLARQPPWNALSSYPGIDSERAFNSSTSSLCTNTICNLQHTAEFINGRHPRSLPYLASILPTDLYRLSPDGHSSFEAVKTPENTLSTIVFRMVSAEDWRKDCRNNGAHEVVRALSEA